MADSKETKLSIIVRTVDQATAKIKAINDRLDAVTKPMRDFKKELSGLYEKSGLSDVAGGFKSVGSEIASLLSKVALVGGVAGGAVAGLFHLVNEFDELGDKAERFGVSVDFLAKMRYAAEKAGAPVGALDEGVSSLSQNLGQLRAGTGRMKAFLDKVSPALERQLAGAKSNEEAFYLLGDAMGKLKDPAKRAALAQKTVGDAALAPLLVLKAKGIKELGDRYQDLAGSQQGAAEEAGKVDDAMHDLKAATDGIKAALVVGLAPALKTIVDRLRDWLRGHRDDIREWAEQLGKRIPDAVAKVVEWVEKAARAVGSFVDKIGGATGVLFALGAFTFAPLISSVVSLTASVGGLAAKAGSVAGSFTLWGAAIAAALVVISGIADMIDEIKGKLTTKNERAIEDLANAKTPEQRAAVMKAAYENRASTFAETDDEKQAWADFARGGLGAMAGIPSMYQTNPADMLKSSPGLLGAAPQSAKVTIDIANAPRGTRVRTDPSNTADIDLSVGYQMIPGAP